ncbi:MAG: hypothetical protein RIR25_832 [Verrucomicrobiota bacterium]
MLFAHQEAAFRSLAETARLCFSWQQWRSLPVRPRFARFVSGPSGCGKTHLAKALAEHLDVPLYAVDASSWMPLGANGRGARTTWTELALWLRDNARGIILIDELDKIGQAEGWLNYVRGEIFSVLDRRLPAGITLGTEEENASSGPAARGGTQTGGTTPRARDDHWCRGFPVCVGFASEAFDGISRG